MYRHRPDPTLATVRPFSGAVAKRQNRAAHGNVCVVDRCRCGAERRSNINGQHVERGKWGEPCPE